MTVLLSVFTVAVLLTLWLASGRSPLAILDHPNERSLHARTVPRSGGIAILLAVALGWGMLLAGHGMPQGLIWIILSAGIVAAVSLLDDLIGLRARTRLPVHMVAAGLVLVGGIGLPWWGWLGWVVSLLGIVWMLNLFNFMDGMDGFAGGMALVGFGCLGWASYMVAGVELYAMLCWVIAAACFGFLLFNFPPARIFMGDVGSVTLGLLAAALSLWGVRHHQFPAWFPLLVFSPFIVDATVTLIRRAIRREHVWQAHREHYYQRLVQAGWGHRKTVLSEYALMVAVGGSALWGLAHPRQALIVSAGWLIAYVALMFLAERRCEAGGRTRDILRDALITMACWLLCMLGVVFPFSVAATSTLLGTILAAGLVSGAWWVGARHMWVEYRSLSTVMLVYWGLMLAGLAWSNNLSWGLHVVGHQWFWLALPVITAVLGDMRWRKRFLTSLSLGLTLHLGFCLLQKFQVVTIVDFGGSNAHDATGFIGHIGFGFIYGIWAGWLLHWGWKQAGWRRWGVWLLAAWAWVMIFAALGRSGYLVALAIMIAVLWRHWIGSGWRKAMLPLALLVVMVGVLAVGPGKQRLAVTWKDITAIHHGDLRDSDPRWSMWIASVYAWKHHPVLGVGTGGFPDAARSAKKAMPNLTFMGSLGEIPVHPHSMYFLSLARWALFGLSAYLVLIFLWIRTGWRQSWDHLEAPLMALSGIALALDGLFAPTMEQQGTGVMLVMTLALALASGWSRDADRL